MDRDAILDGIASRTDVDRTEAERAAIATLTTLGEHVSKGEAQDVAHALPPELGDAATSRSAASPESFDVDEFVRRVVSREGGDVDEAEAVRHVRATFATLADRGARDELREAREQLPNEFASLFDTADVEVE